MQLLNKGYIIKAAHSTRCTIAELDRAMTTGSWGSSGGRMVVRDLQHDQKLTDDTGCRELGVRTRFQWNNRIVCHRPSDVYYYFLRWLLSFLAKRTNISKKIDFSADLSMLDVGDNNLSEMTVSSIQVIITHTRHTNESLWLFLLCVCDTNRSDTSWLSLLLINLPSLGKLLVIFWKENTSMVTAWKCLFC